MFQSKTRRTAVVTVVLGLALTATAPAQLALARLPKARIVFVSSDENGLNGLRSIKPTGRKRRILTRGRHTAPQWSPDRSKIAFVRMRGSRPVALMVMQADGSNKRKVAPYTTFSPDYGSEGFDWSPNSRRLVYSRRGPGASNYNLFVVNVFGGDPRRITSHPDDEVDPSWSPNGRRIAFSTSRSLGDEGDIYTVAPSGRNRTRLTTAPKSDMDPEWRPRGSVIAFTSERDDEPGTGDDVYALRMEIYVMRGDGTDERRVTRKESYKEDLQWSSDGSGTLLFVETCDDRTCIDAPRRMLVAVQSRGGGRRELLGPGWNWDDPAWGPNSDWIVYTARRRGAASRDLYLVHDEDDLHRRVTNTPNSFEGSPDWD